MNRLLTVLVLSILFFNTTAQESLQSNFKLDVLGLRNIPNNTFNGLSLAIAVTPSYRETINGGLVGGMVVTGAKEVNGFAIGGLYTVVDTLNGFVFAPGVSKLDYMNGLSIGLSMYSERANGVSLSLASGSFNTANGLHVAGLVWFSTNYKGASLSAINLTKGRLSGLQIGIYNQTATAKGVQLGLINYIKENPKGLRILPFINMQWKD